MKQKLFYLSLLAAAAFTGCTTSDEDAVPGGKQDPKVGYVAVNIVQVQDTRAGFENGTEAESVAKTGSFFIYDSKSGAGKWYDVSFVGTTEQTNGGNVERIYEAVLVIDGETSNEVERSMICVLNAPAEVKNFLTLAAVEKAIGDYSACADNSFIMSNTVYRGTVNGQRLCGIPLTGHVFTSAPEAYASPVDVYVERVLAKIKVKTQEGGMTNGGANPKVDGKEKALQIKLIGVEIANIAETAYLTKDLDKLDLYGADFRKWYWNDPDNFRSYWETIPSEMTYSNKSYNQIMDTENGGYTFEDNSSILPHDLQEYVQPNVSNVKQHTAVLVTVQLMDGEKQADLAYIRGGYTTQDGAKNVIAKHVAQTSELDYWKKVPTTVEGETKLEQLSADDFIWMNNEDFKAAKEAEVEGLFRYEVVAQVKPATEDAETHAKTYMPLYNKNGELIENGAQELNNYFKGKTAGAVSHRARVFTDGMCYYYVNIDQTPVARERIVAGNMLGDHEFDGVIRNHIYDLTLTDIKGVGTPIFDPDDIIIPETPDKETAYYLAARINVLAWKIVSQNVSFNGQ